MVQIQAQLRGGGHRLLGQEAWQQVTSATTSFHAKPSKTYPARLALPEGFAGVRVVQLSKREIKQ